MTTTYGTAPRKAFEAIFQYAFVKILGTTDVEILDGAVATDFAWGVCQTLAAIGDPVEVETRRGMIGRAVASAAFAAGVRLKVGSGADHGKVLTQTAGTFTVATALETATAAGAIVRVVYVFETIALP